MSEGQISPKNPKAIVGWYWLEVVSQNELDLIDVIFAPNYILHDYSLCASEGPHGRDDLKKVLANFRECYPDLRAIIEEQIAQGNQVVTRYRLLATQPSLPIEIPTTTWQ